MLKKLIFDFGSDSRAIYEQIKIRPIHLSNEDLRYKVTRCDLYRAGYVSTRYGKPCQAAVIKVERLIFVRFVVVKRYIENGELIQSTCAPLAKAFKSQDAVSAIFFIFLPINLSNPRIPMHSARAAFYMRFVLLRRNVTIQEK